jgi:hypothetical protein
MWYYLKPEDYSNIILKVKDLKLKQQLYGQYTSRIPMLKSAYERLKKEYR